MTDKQFDVLMNSIIQIVKDSKTKDEAVEKLQNLVKGKGNWLLSLICLIQYYQIYESIIIFLILEI